VVEPHEEGIREPLGLETVHVAKVVFPLRAELATRSSNGVLASAADTFHLAVVGHLHQFGVFVPGQLSGEFL
jgi:hypothetical protein